VVPGPAEVAGGRNDMWGKNREVGKISLGNEGGPSGRVGTPDESKGGGGNECCN